MDFFTKLNNGLGYLGNILLLGTIVAVISSGTIFFIKKIRLLFRLNKNLSKEIYIVLPNSSDDYNMGGELGKIDDKIFKIRRDNIKTSYGNLEKVKNLGTVIIGYKKGCTNIETFKSLLTEIGKTIPIIFYTYGDNQAFDFRPGSTDEFAKYLSENHNNYLIDNFPLKLVGDIYSIMSVHK